MSVEFSEEAEQRFQDITSQYPTNLAALLPVMMMAQEEFGWISVEVMDYVADRLDVPEAQVYSTATFYTLLNKKPVGKCHIQVCTTFSCALEGGYEILEHLEEQLDIQVGETDPEHNFTLTEVECLASCGTAPMFQVTTSDGEMEFYEDLSTEKVDEILEDLNEALDELPDPREMQ